MKASDLEGQVKEIRHDIEELQAHSRKLSASVEHITRVLEGEDNVNTGLVKQFGSFKTEIDLIIERERNLLEKYETAIGILKSINTVGRWLLWILTSLLAILGYIKGSKIWENLKGL